MSKWQRIGRFVADYFFDTIGDGIRRTEDRARKERRILSNEFYRKKANYEQCKARYELYKNRYK